MGTWSKDESSKPPGSRSAKASSDASPAAAPLHELQQTLGNQGVQRLLRASVIQTNLAIGQPDDPYEREADQFADRVMDMPEAPLQRVCACGGECPKCRAEQPGQEHVGLRMKSHGSGDTGQTAAPQSVHEALRSPGQPLDAATRTFMEPRFGHDFSGVRVHTDVVAQQSALDLNARAYTVGPSIVFDSGRYAPTTKEGRRLLAHELAHVVQQSRTPANGRHTVQRSPNDPQPGGAQAKPSARKSPRKLPFPISFDTPLSRAEFIELAETTIFGRPVHLHWTNVREHYSPSDSPVTATVPEHLVRSEFAARIEALPRHIQKFLTTGEGKVASPDELRSVAEAGAILEFAGVTEEELLLREQQQAEAEAFGGPKPESEDPATWAAEFVQQRGESALKAFKNRTEFMSAVSKMNDWSQDDKNGIKNVLDGNVPENVLHSILHRHGMMYWDLVHGFEFELKSFTSTFLSQAQVALFRIEKAYLADRNVGSEKERLRQVVASIRPALERRDKAARELGFRKVERPLAPVVTAITGKQDPAVSKAEENLRKKDEALQEQAKAAGFGVAGWETFDLDILRGTDMEKSRNSLRQFVYSARSKLHSAEKKTQDVKYLYNADRMIAFTKAALGIADGSPMDDIVSFRVKEASSDDGFWSTVWDVVSFALMFVPGNVGVLLRVAAGLVNVTKAVDVFAELEGMHQTGLASAPSSVGVFLAVGGTLIDAQQMAKGFVKVLDAEASAGAKLGSKASTSAESTLAHEGEGLAVKFSADSTPVVVPKGVSDETVEMLAKRRPDLAEALAKNPRAASALTLCESLCIPEFATKAQVERIEKLMADAEGRGLQLDKSRVKEYFHRCDDRADLTEAIDELEQAMHGARPGQPPDVAKSIMDEVDVLEQPGVAKTKPVDVRLAEAKHGRRFDTREGRKYPYNQIPIRDKAGTVRRLDSYDPTTHEIISRKSLVASNGQIAFVDEMTMVEHFQEFALKYPNGARAADTAAAKRMGISKQLLTGNYVLEVPVQNWDIPERIIEEANKRGVKIRDVNGKLYN